MTGFAIPHTTLEANYCIYFPMPICRPLDHDCLDPHGAMIVLQYVSERCSPPTNKKPSLVIIEPPDIRFADVAVVQLVDRYASPRTTSDNK